MQTPGLRIATVIGFIADRGCRDGAECPSADGRPDAGTTGTGRHDTGTAATRARAWYTGADTRSANGWLRRGDHVV